MHTAFAEDLTPKIFILIALLMLILAILTASFCSIKLEHYYKFDGDITVDALYVTNPILLIDRFGIDPVILYNSKVINITFINPCKQCVTTLQVFYKNEEFILLNTYDLKNNKTIMLEPPYNSYLFILNSLNLTCIKVIIEGIYIYYPFKYLSIFSLFLFLAGTFILLYSYSVIIISNTVRNFNEKGRAGTECAELSARFKGTT